MFKPINFDKVADLYDLYVNVDFDIPFFIKETKACTDEILELMCGTGRVSIPLLKSGKKMVCVDYSKAMLNNFSKKIKNENFCIELVHQDITELKLGRKFRFAFIPFHSLSEILSFELQHKAIKAISNHLEAGSILILTLQNPVKRIKLADGSIKIAGTYNTDDGNSLLMTYMNQYLPDKEIVNGIQFYEIYNPSNVLIEKRFLEINFRPVSDSDVKTMIRDAGLIIRNVYGSYNYEEFNEESSDFLIYIFEKK